MNVQSRFRAPIQLPLEARRKPVFAMAGGTDIAALAQAFEGHNATVQAALTDTSNKIDKITAEIDKLNEKQAALVLSGGGRNNSRQSNLRAEVNAIQRYFSTKQVDELQDIHNRAVASGVSALMTVGSDPDGGYVVLPEYSKSMTEKLWDFSAMRRLARVESIAGAEWLEPIDNGQIGSGWVGETDVRSQTSTPKISMLRVPLNELYAMPPISQALLDTSGFDLAPWITGKIADKFGRDEGVAFISGDGVSKPQGLLSYPISTDADALRPWWTIQYVPTGADGDLPNTNPADPLKTLVWSLRAPYRAGATWLMNSNTMSRIDKLKDGMGNYLLRPGLAAGMPDMLLGYPVAIDDVAMPDIGTNSLSIAFGNFKLAYVIVDGIGIRLIRDPYTAKPLVLFYAYRRTGGGLANSEAVKLLRFSAT